MTRLASTKKAYIRRVAKGASRVETAEIDLNKVSNGKAADLELAPGDVVVVPSSNFKSYMQAASAAAVNSGIFAGLQVLARF
jgi:hypothetical protein